MTLTLDAINDDVLVCIFAALSIPDILTLRKVCRTLRSLSTQYIVWRNACQRHILDNDIPFSHSLLSTLCASDLEYRTLKAYKLGENWRSHSIHIQQTKVVPGKTGAIEEIKFLNNRGRNWIVTTSRGIWSNLYLWDSDTLQIVACWSPRRALFNGMTVNTDQNSDGAIAISAQLDGSTSIEILSIVKQGSASDVTLQTICTLHTKHRPITLRGDLIALSDHDSETLILNWRTLERSILRSPDTWQVTSSVQAMDHHGLNSRQDKPLHVVFLRGIVIVVRARSICLFVEPPLTPPQHESSITLPYACSSFGWVDGVSVAVTHPRQHDVNGSFPSVSILIRTMEDPWARQDLFRLYTLNSEIIRNLSTAPLDCAPVDRPRSLPLNLAYSFSCPRNGPLRCSDMVLGPYGTAIWVQPADWSTAGLISDDVHLQPVPVPTSQDILVAVMFPGRLSGGSSAVANIEMSLTNRQTSWSCLDYDEERGFIALGTTSGAIMRLSL